MANVQPHQAFAIGAAPDALAAANGLHLHIVPCSFTNGDASPITPQLLPVFPSLTGVLTVHFLLVDSGPVQIFLAGDADAANVPFACSIGPMKFDVMHDKDLLHQRGIPIAGHWLPMDVGNPIRSVRLQFVFDAGYGECGLPFDRPGVPYAV